MVGSYPKQVVGRAGYHMHDQLAPIGLGTYRAALGSANLAADAAQRVLKGAGSIYALCRPPGPSCLRDMGGGACFFNNAAVAAEYLRRSLDRVAILDVDVRHGNGTQGILYQRADVYYVSIYRDPSEYHAYFIGYADERGEGHGADEFRLDLAMDDPSDRFVALFC
jgi:acetoin utilization deacetylase AcuC-like enzyme